MFTGCIIILTIAAKHCSSQDEEGPYRGKLIGKFNSYHHQVAGDVYAVDEWSLLLVDFSYDGAGDDAYFWAGDAPRPGPQGFIVPDQRGKTNVLERHHVEELRLTLPEGKTVSRLRWLAVYDVAAQTTFADVYLPEQFEPPAPRRLPPLTGEGAVSGGVTVEDADTLLISGLRYEGGAGEAHFLAGVGPQPSAKGIRIPDEYGYLEPVRPHRGEDVRLRLPAPTSVFSVDWLALYDLTSHRTLASVAVPEGLSVPPALSRDLPAPPALPNCLQLHSRLRVSWEVFGNTLTVQLVGQIGDNGYMAFGISGSSSGSRMLGADVAVARWDGAAQRGHAADYNVTAATPCVQVLGAWRGVCRDTLLSGLDDNQVLGASRTEGLTAVTYRRTLKPGDPMDLEWTTDRPVYVVWALGELDPEGEPAFHTDYPGADLALHLTGPPSGPEPPPGPAAACHPFVSGGGAARSAWERAELSEPTLRTFTATLGPGGGRRGYAAWGAGGPPPPLVWYLNGHMAPALQLRRGLVYEFRVRGGADPHSPALYHPLVVTTGARGGPDSIPDAAVRTLAGVARTRRGRPAPTAAGPACVARHPPEGDRRRDDDYPTFRAYNRSLVWTCEPGPPAVLRVAPNSSWPDLVYYHSFTHRGMGGPIYIVDRHRRGLSRRSGAPCPATAGAALLLAAVLLTTVR